MSKRGERGCGFRAENGLYVCVGTSPLGRPTEDFLVDPVLPWKGGQLRAPMLVPDREKTVHMILGVGKAYYPFVSDFVEETRRVGLSKRVPRNFEVEKLSPDRSKLLLTHPRGIPDFPYRLDCVTCPKDIRKEHECIGALWHLSSLKDFEDKHHVERDYETLMVKVSTPSAVYYVSEPLSPKVFEDNYSNGIFLGFPLRMCRFEYVNKEGKVPAKLKERMEKAEFTLDVVPE